MKLGKRKPSGREKDEAAVERLNELREKLHSQDISTARRAGHNLSWMQEDGLDILKEALFGNFPTSAKKAAAYGLRCMHGRMKKTAWALLQEGQKHSDRATREICGRAISLMEGKTPEKIRPSKKRKPGKFRIREISNQRGKRAPSRRRRTPSGR